MPSEQFTTTVELLAASGLTTDATTADRRATIDGLGMILTAAPGTTVDPVDADGVPCAWVTPPDLAGPGAVLWLHGGGYNIGSITSHQAAASYLASHLGRPVLLVDYRLAPEHPYPAALDDATTAWQWLVANGNDPQQSVVVGDSAGAGLAVAMTTALVRDNIARPAALALLCPWVDLTGAHPVPDQRLAADVVLTPALLAQWATAYCGPTTPADHPGVSPLFGDLSGLPPLHIQAGGRDILLDDARRLADQARACGVAVDLEVDDDMIHAWQLFASAFPEAEASLAMAASWLRDHISDAG